jgi:hypothetical protein
VRIAYHQRAPNAALALCRTGRNQSTLTTDRRTSARRANARAPAARQFQLHKTHYRLGLREVKHAMQAFSNTCALQGGQRALDMVETWAGGISCLRSGLVSFSHGDYGGRGPVSTPQICRGDGDGVLESRLTG